MSICGYSASYRKSSIGRRFAIAAIGLLVFVGCGDEVRNSTEPGTASSLEQEEAQVAPTPTPLLEVVLPDEVEIPPTVTPIIPPPDTPFGYAEDIYFDEESAPTPEQFAQGSPIVSGSIVEVLPSRWSTPDGERPEDPWSVSPLRTYIYTPAVIEIDDGMLIDRGSELGVRSGDRMTIAVFGGEVGDDVFESGNPSQSLESGGRVLVLLADRPLYYGSGSRPGRIRVDGDLVWFIQHQYVLDDDGNATLVHAFPHTLPIDELMQRIEDAQELSE